MLMDVGSEEYTVYADDEIADAYLGASIHAANWSAATLLTKGQALVTATRTLDRQVWRDEYNTFELREAVPAIVAASIEMALALVDGTDVQNADTNTERVRSMSAGSVNISYFFSSVATTRFPRIVQELLLPYIGGSGADFVSKAVGVDTETIFPANLGFNLGGIS